MNSLQCETCGNAIAADAPSGLCPICLLRTAIEHGSSQALAPLLPKLRYFGDYELLEEIARGGMGVVYRAKQVSLDRTVALKMMRPGLLSTASEIQQFLSEARTAASLQHPNIVAIHEAGEFDGLHYFSMDFVEGPNLAAVVRGGPLSPVEAARYVQILAETVHYAHTQGILHRDLKPSNVLVDAGGRPHITDFGLTRRLDNDSTVTGSGTIVGTPAYMPPEQALGQTRNITAASDVYALGAILYELLTGQPPFRAGNQLEIVRMVMETEPARPRSLNPAVDAGIEAICLRCLAKEPAARFQSAAELADDLKRFLEGEPVHSRIQRRSAYRYIWIPLLTAVCVLMAWVWLRNPPPPKRGPIARSEIVPAAKPPQNVIQIPVAKPPAIRKKQEAKAVPSPVTAAVPTPIAASISPETGSGYTQVFSFHYPASPELESPAEFEVDFRDETATDARHCNILINPSTARVQLQFDPLRGPALRVSGNLGTLDRIENSICAIDLSGVTLNRRENATDLLLPMTFKPSFDGAKTIESWVRKKQNAPRSETTLTGQWTVGPGPDPKRP
jgi:serine/threonine protein kinase